MTREKVLKIITDWIDDPRLRCLVIWLNDPAGAGKSAIAQTIAGRCFDEQLAVSFLFLRNSSEEYCYSFVHNAGMAVRKQHTRNTSLH